MSSLVHGTSVIWARGGYFDGRDDLFMAPSRIKLHQPKAHVSKHVGLWLDSGAQPGGRGYVACVIRAGQCWACRHGVPLMGCAPGSRRESMYVFMHAPRTRGSAGHEGSMLQYINITWQQERLERANEKCQSDMERSALRHRSIKVVFLFRQDR
ncbi:hypothetical protein J3458_015544 [Metarhizium acridum]|uniref:uncharacterized protein n=1 Tax=Metarhizium acridum TaxID=92637 RepID=UPI001C6B081D|nr:hypothetical protein J3458_015544 [Metarhizium acridum]